MEELNDYLGELIMTHCDRVEQYGRWLKCTRDGVYSDIYRTREEILKLFKDLSRRSVDDENGTIFEEVCL